MESVLIEKDIRKLREEFHNDVEYFQRTINKRIESVDGDETKYFEKLKKLGFTNVDGVQEHQTKISTLSQKNNLIKSVTDMMNFYGMNFPQYFIIPLKNMITVSEKYNLIFGPIGNFKNLIPEVNLDEIEQFQKHLKNALHKNFFIFNNKKNVIDNGADFSIKETYSSDNVYSHQLFITAPKEMFVLNSGDKIIGSTIVNDPAFNMLDNFKQVKKEMSEERQRRLQLLRDPIIWTPVKFPFMGGACMIITKWGEEAKYPEFANPITN